MANSDKVAEACRKALAKLEAMSDEELTKLLEESEDGWFSRTMKDSGTTSEDYEDI